MKTKKLTPQQEIDLIEKKMGYTTFERPESSFDWINLGDKDFNEVMGHRKHGIRNGCIIELHGPESAGKTTISKIIGAIAQKQDQRHTYVAKIDLEGSNSDEFNERMRIDMSKFFLFKVKLITDAKAVKRLAKIDAKKDPDKYREVLAKTQKVTETAQQLCKKVEKWIKFKRDLDPKARIILIVDSVTGLLVEEEMDADLDNQNMRTNVSLATFLSKLCRRWVGFAENYNCIIIMINQERTAPGVMYGNPTYTSGGKALKFYASIRARVTRVKGGRIKKDGKVIGIRTMITNEKNKVGGAEGHKVGVKILTRKGRFEVMKEEDIVREAKKEKSNG